MKTEQTYRVQKEERKVFRHKMEIANRRDLTSTYLPERPLPRLRTEAAELTPPHRRVDRYSRKEYSLIIEKTLKKSRYLTQKSGKFWNLLPKEPNFILIRK